MHPDLVLASRLQACDQKILALEKEISALPRYVADIEKQLDAHLRQLEADKGALAANLRDRKKFEGDVELAKQKNSKLKDQMMSAKTNEQYKAFQHEIDHFEKEMRAWDDRTLDLMAAAEPLEAAVREAEAKLKIEKHHVESEKAKAQARTQKDQIALEEVRRERAKIGSELPQAMLSLYEKVKKRWGPTVVAELDGDLCKGCKLSLRPQFIQDLKLGEKPLQCENCGRLLIYNPPVAAVEG